MPELPVAPGFKQESTQENITQYVYTSGEFARGIDISANRLSSEAAINLGVEDTPDPTVWESVDASSIERPIEAIAPKSRAQQIAESPELRSVQSTVQLIANHTRAIPAMRRAA